MAVFGPFLRVAVDRRRGQHQDLPPPSLRSDEPTGLRPVPRSTSAKLASLAINPPFARPPRGPAPDRKPLEKRGGESCLRCSFLRETQHGGGRCCAEARLDRSRGPFAGAQSEAMGDVRGGRPAARAAGAQGAGHGFSWSKAFHAPQGAFPFRGRQAACPGRGCFRGFGGSAPVGSSERKRRRSQCSISEHSERAVLKARRVIRSKILIRMDTG